MVADEVYVFANFALVKISNGTFCNVNQFNDIFYLSLEFCLSIYGGENLAENSLYLGK